MEAFEPMEITFRKGGTCGIPVRDGISKHFSGLEKRDSRPFEGVDVAEQCTLRIEVSICYTRPHLTGLITYRTQVARVPTLEQICELRGR